MRGMAALNPTHADYLLRPAAIALDICLSDFLLLAGTWPVKFRPEP